MAKEMTEKEIQEAKKRALDILNRLNELLPKNLKIEMTDEQITTFAKTTAQRRLYHEKAKAIRDYQKKQSSQYKEQFPHLNVPDSLARCVISYYITHEKDDQETIEKNNQLLGNLGKFSQEGIDYQLEFSKKVLNEIAAFDPKKYTREISEQLFDQLSNGNQGFAYRLFEMQNIYSNLKNDFSIPKDIETALKDRQHAMVGIGGEINKVVEGFSDENTIFFPFENLSLEQLGLLAGTKSEYHSICDHFMGYNFDKQDPLNLKYPDPVVITADAIQPTKFLLNRFTELESIGDSLGRVLATYKPGSKNHAQVSEKYQPFLTTQSNFREELKNAAQNPSTFDRKNFLADYVRFQNRLAEERAHLDKVIVNKDKTASKDEIVQARRDLEFIKNLTCGDLKKFKDCLEYGIPEQIEKNIRTLTIDQKGMIADFKFFNNEFKKDSYFSRPKDKAYTDFAKALENMPATLGSLKGDRLKLFSVVDHELKDLKDKAHVFVESCKSKASFNDNDVKRLKAANRVLDYIEASSQSLQVARKDIGNVYLDERLAAKIVDAFIDKGLRSNDQEKVAEATDLLTNRTARKEKVQKMMELPGFAQLVQNARHKTGSVKTAEEAKEYMLHMKGSDLMEDFNTAQIEAKQQAKEQEKKKHLAELNEEMKARQEFNKEYVESNKALMVPDEPKNKLNHLISAANNAITDLSASLYKMGNNPNAVPSRGDNKSVAIILALEIIKAEQEAQKAIGSKEKGPMEKCLEQNGSNAFVSGVYKSSVMKGLMGEDGIPQEALKALVGKNDQGVFNCKVLATEIVKSSAHKEQIMNGATAAKAKREEKSKQIEQPDLSLKK